MTDIWAEGISIIVPTYKRPGGIKIALESLRYQTCGNRSIEIVVADNDPAASAKSYVDSFAKNCLHEIVYIHVPEPGVSNARNGALSVARGRFLAFLDDDMEALPYWLNELVTASLKYKAAITFGPAIAVMPEETPINDYLKPFFSRIADAPEGLISETLGTGGCLLDLSICNMPSPPFDSRFNETGGEDDALFQHLIENGAKVAWAIKAEAYEHVPIKRATPEYVWTRNFAFGQGPTQEAADNGLRGFPGIVKWMSVGAVQLAIYAPPYLLLKLFGAPKYIRFQARTAQAVGKILWWQNFSQKLYGANATTEGSTA